MVDTKEERFTVKGGIARPCNHEVSLAVSDVTYAVKVYGKGHVSSYYTKHLASEYWPKVPINVRDFFHNSQR